MTSSRATVPLLALLIVLAMSSAGCEVIGGIFKAGMWVGIIMVVILVVAVMWIVGKLRR